MTPKEFDFVAALVRRECGLVLTPDKSYLVESRLISVARRWGKANVDELIGALMRLDQKPMIRDVVESMVTNESFFFRDKRPFDQFRDLVLPYLLTHRAQRRHIRIWSAACSTGQEPYSLAMILKEQAARLAGWRVDIVATDVSNEVLQRARDGWYSQFEVQRGLPINLLVKYFRQDGERWQIAPEIRSMVDYRPFNLLQDPVSLGAFDVVFCRNVLIYFDPATKAAVLARTAKQMADDGFLFLGGAETVLGITDAFRPMPEQRGVYGKALPGDARPSLRAAAG